MSYSKTVSVATLASFAAALSLQSQVPRLTVGREIQASRAFSARRFGEVIACSHPSDRKHLLMAAMYDTVDASGSQVQPVVLFVSRDGGATWASRLDTWDGSRGTPDPSCVIAPNGSAYLATMTLTRQRGPIALYRSRDNGTTWSQPALIGTGGYDRPWITAGDGRPGQSKIYISAFYETRAPFARDLATFAVQDTNPLRIASAIQRSHYFHNGPLALLSNDLVIGVFAHPTTRAQEPPSLPEPVGGWPTTPIVAATRWDGETTLAPPVAISALTSQAESKRFLLTDFIPSLAVDRRSRWFRGRLYSTWVDASTGALRVLLSYSADSGKTWSTPRIVSDDGTGSTDERPLDSVNPAVAVNDSGIVAVLWYDRRDNADFGYWPRLAASLDGGETWTASVRVSTRAMVARLDGLHTLVAPRRVNGESTQELAFEIHSGWNFRPGDTAGLIADAGGTFHPFWIDNRTGFPQVWTAPVHVEGRVQRMRDITDSTAIALSRLRYDSATRRITVTATVKPIAAVTGPIVLHATSIRSNISDRVSARGTANGIAGVGATWTLPRGNPDFSTTLEFSLGPWKRASLNPLAVTVRVLTPEDGPNRNLRPNER
jgi:hypothetical protein